MDGSESNAKKTILCYGDSNTWGYVPGSFGERFPSHVRWPGVLSKLLRTDYWVIEEGLCGRTAITDDPISALNDIERNGFKTLGAILETHAPIDLAVLMLGANDLRHSARLPACDIAAAVGILAQFARSNDFGPGFSAPPEVLIVCPNAIWEVDAYFGPRFKGGRDISLGLRGAFRELNRQFGFPVIYADDFVQVEPVDGLHLSAESHAVLAQEIARWILEREGEA
ncbi:MAG: GDSL-type esterase/lipase family protein [Planctomycetota bacterium]|jgi:lysophospholipase L1-like esterase|nr:GDSL-type esterase/lipase family protein [Planctomycetota bacterium]